MCGTTCSIVRFVFLLSCPVLCCSWQFVDSVTLSKEWKQIETGTNFSQSLPWDKGDNELRDFIQEKAYNNMVIISFLTVSLIDHASNMRCHLELCRLEKHHIVFAADKRAFESLKIWNFNVWPAFGLVDTDPSIERVHVSFLVIFHRPSFRLTPCSFPQGTGTFARLVKLKILLTLRVLRLGFDVVYSDVDIAILENVFLYIDKNIPSGDDVVFLTDNHVDLNKSSGRFQYLCSGLYFAKARVNVIHKFFEVLAYLENPRNSKRDDQIAINAIFANYKASTDIKVSVFNRMLFPNGYTFFHKHILQQLGVRPIIVHANYILGQKMKRFQLQLHGLWLAKKSGGCLKKSEMEYLASRAASTDQHRPLTLPSTKVLPTFLSSRQRYPRRRLARSTRRMKRRYLVIVCVNRKALLETKRSTFAEEMRCRLHQNNVAYFSAIRNNCSQDRGVLIATALSMGYSPLWINPDRYIVHGSHSLRHMLSLFSQERDLKQLYVSTYWKPYSVFGEFERFGKDEILASRAIKAVASQRKANSKREREPFHVCWDVVFVPSLPRKKWLIALFNTNLYLELSKCFPVNLPFNPPLFLPTIVCHNQRFKVGMSSKIVPVRWSIFNPLKVTTTRDIFFSTTLPQNLGLAPFLLVHENDKRSAILENVCCRCGSNIILEWFDYLPRDITTKCRFSKILRKFYAMLKSEEYFYKRICEFGVDLSTPFSIIWRQLQSNKLSGTRNMYALFFQKGSAGDALNYETFMEARLIDRTRFRTFEVANETGVSKYAHLYPHLKCDFMIVHSSFRAARDTVIKLYASHERAVALSLYEK